MRSWMRYSMYIISLILVALILLPSLAVGKPPEDKGKDKDNGKPPKTEDEVEFVIIESSSGPHGNVSPSGSVKVKIGDDQRFKISANGGYRIKEVVVDSKTVVFSCDSEGNEHVRKWEYCFENVQESQDRYIYAEFDRDVFTIKALARGAGTISPPGAVKVSYGGSQDFSIRATQGFCIDDVQISPSDDKNTLDMDAAKGASTYTFPFNDVTSDYTIIVTFARLKEPEPDPETDPVSLTIKSEAVGTGSIDPSGEVEVEYGSEQTFTMIPDPCNGIAEVLVDGVPVDDVYVDEGTGEVTYTFYNVTSDHTIHATFEEITYTITASAEGGGSIEPSDKVEVACSSSDQTFTITPDDPCHRIAVVEVDGEEVGVDIDAGTGEVTYTFYNVTSDHTIHATFEEVTEPYTITASAGDFGSIEPSGEVKVACGSEQVSFTITPDEPCYGIAVVEVDGVPVDAGIDEATGEVKYTFTSVASDHTIHATFEKITCTITATAGEHGSIIPSGKVPVEYGGSQLFKIKPDEGYTRGSVLIDGDPVKTKGNKYEFTDVDSDHTIEVTFVEDPDEDDLKGDVNNDGKVNSGDAIFILLIITGQIEPTEQQELAADVNGDGVIDIDDALYVLNIVAGLSAPEANVDRPDGEVTIKLEAANGIAGERVTIPLKAENATGLAGGRISIIYDSTVLRAVGISSDPDVLMASNVTEPGVAYIAFASAKGLNDGTLLKIQFDVLADSVSSLNLRNVKLYRSDALPIDGRLIDGHFASWAMRPENSALLQNFPNPFNPETWIPFRLSEGSEVTIEIYDAMGHLVRRLPLGHKPAGSYTSQERAAYWDGCNEDGERVASGVYFYAIRAANFTDTKKMIIAQ